MSILWMGGEDFDQIAGTQITLGAQAGYYDSNYSRGDLMTNTSFWGNAPAGTTAVLEQFAGGAVTSFWLSFMLCWKGSSGQSARICGLGLASTFNKGLFIRPTALKLSVCKFDGTDETVLATGTTTISQFCKVDVQVTSYGASGTVKVYIDGGQIADIDFTGNLAVTDVANLDCVMVVCPGAVNSGLSEIIVADQDTRPMRLVTIVPSAAGDANQMNGVYSDISDLNMNDATMLYTNTAGQGAQFNMTAPIAGNYKVLAARIAARMAKSADASIGTVKLGVRSGGSTDVDAGHALAESFAVHSRIITTVGGNPITRTILDEIQIAFESAA